MSRYKFKLLFLPVLLFFLLFFSCTEDEIVKDPEEVVVTDKSVELGDSSIVVDNKKLMNSATGTAGMEWDTQTGIMTMTKASAIQAGYHFRVNHVLSCDLDTAGILRRITQLDSTNVDYILYTEQATLEDFFRNLDVRLTTQVSPDQLTSANLSPKEISAALTDEEGVVHPYKIIRHNEDGSVQSSWSAHEPLPAELGGSHTLNVDYDYSGKVLFDKKLSNGEAKLFVKNGYIHFRNTTSIDLSLKTEWESHWPWPPVPHTYIRKFHCTNNSTFSTYTGLEFDIDASFEYKDTYLIAQLNKTSFCFWVGAAPVWVTVDSKLYGNITASASSSLQATAGLGYEITSCEFGVRYTHDDGWSPVKNFSNKFIKEPFTVQGDARLSARTEIYPRIFIQLDGVAGPYVDLVPYLETDNIFAFDYTTGGDKNTYWSSEFTAGLDTRLGAKVEVLGHTLKSYNSGDIALLDPYTIYQAPHKIEVISGNNQTGSKGRPLAQELNVKVLDSWGNAVPLVPVYFEPETDDDGAVANHLQYTNSDGVCSTTWTLGTDENQQKLKASIKILYDPSHAPLILSSVTFDAVAN